MLLRIGHLHPQKGLQRVILAFRLRLLYLENRLLDESALPWVPAELLEEVQAEGLRQGEQVQWEGEDLRPLLLPGSQAQMQISHNRGCTVHNLNMTLEHYDPSSHQRSSLTAICGISAVNILASFEACLPDGLLTTHCTTLTTGLQ